MSAAKEPHIARHELVIAIFKQVDQTFDAAKGPSVGLSESDMRRFEGDIRRDSSNGPVVCLQLLSAAIEAKKLGMKRLAGQLTELARAGIKQLQVEQQHDDGKAAPAERKNRNLTDGLGAPKAGVGMRKGGKKS